MNDTVMDLTLFDDAGDSHSPMSDFRDVSANQQASECSDLVDLLSVVSEPVTAGDTGCVVISDYSIVS